MTSHIQPTILTEDEALAVTQSLKAIKPIGKTEFIDLENPAQQSEASKK